MKKYLRILAALVSVAVLWLGYSYFSYLQDHPVHCSDTIEIYDQINPETFVAVRDCLVRFTAEKKTLVVKDSAGGDAFAALAMGILINRHNWDVEVVGICPSSCANWIFPAGKTKYLNRESMLLFHGGPHQANMLEMIGQLENTAAKNGAPVASGTLGREGKEGSITWTTNKSAARDEVLEFLSINKDARPVELWRQFTNASDRFYQQLGIDPMMPELGQIGRYEPSYKSDKYGGFIYRLDSLRRLGVQNIVLKDGEWRPERHPAYADVYEVTYP